jgi:hypothetical protein
MLVTSMMEILPFDPQYSHHLARLICSHYILPSGEKVTISGNEPTVICLIMVTICCVKITTLLNLFIIYAASRATLAK